MGAVDFLILVQRELMLFAAMVFLVFGIEELVVDLAWLLRTVWRRATIYRRAPPMAASAFAVPATTPQFAILIPAWKEAAVIDAMLAHALQSYGGHRFHIFVGCYENDPDTLTATAPFISESVTIAHNPRTGPTTKGDCLNIAWRQMCATERLGGYRFDAVILHDAEDLVDRDELRVFAALLDRMALMQLPVIPLRLPETRWIAGHYCDEFAEAHCKTMVLREASGASVPSAGVGCCIRRDLMDRLCDLRGGDPFDPDCLTEDYELGLIARSLGMRGAFVRVGASDGFGLVATRAHFPATLEAAIRQKSRWIAGIAMSGWDRMGWGRGIAEYWMRYRDRRVLFEAIVILSAYVAAILYGVLQMLPVAPDLLVDPVLQWMLAVNLALMCWRLAMRAFFTWRVYGVGEALLSIPRAPVSNMIAILAARRAVMLYFRMQFAGRAIWEKTDHSFPQAVARRNG